MDRIIQKVEFDKPTEKKFLRVAAYSRVSCGKDAMLHSLSAQVSYYSQYIQNHENWIYCGVYSDEAITGTKENRENFQRLIKDCNDGKIDLIITKSISRFARNTVTLLSTVRELKALGIGVIFEEQNINTLTSEGELMLTILASYAQEESLSVSENTKWRIHSDFKKGILPLNFNYTYGYLRTPEGGFEIVPEEAEVIKLIFSLFLDGYGIRRIANTINELGIKSNTYEKWSAKKIRYILSNEIYMGDLRLQKNFSENHLTKKKIKNIGQQPQYYVQEDHEPIISREIFEAVQKEFERRAKKHYKGRAQQSYIFTKKIVCGNCGKNYRRKINSSLPIWICSTYDKQGKAECPSKQIPEHILYKISSEVLEIQEFDDKVFEREIEKIIVSGANELVFIFRNGNKIEKKWSDHSRRDSWTPEMKEKARQKTLERIRENGKKDNCNSCNN